MFVHAQKNCVKRTTSLTINSVSLQPFLYQKSSYKGFCGEQMNRLYVCNERGFSRRAYTVGLVSPNDGFSYDGLTSSSSVYETGCISWASIYTRIPKKWALMLVKEWTCQREGELDRKASFFHVLYIGCQQKVWPRLKVGTTMPGSGTYFVPG